MKKIFLFLNKAYQSLRKMFDPAIEGSPYVKTNKTNRFYKPSLNFPYVIWRV